MFFHIYSEEITFWPNDAEGARVAAKFFYARYGKHLRKMDTMFFHI
jgi:hypothetical protein